MAYAQPEPEIDGFMTVNELNWLYSNAAQMDSIVEIGSWNGRSSHALLSGCPGTVWCVDHFMGSPGDQGVGLLAENPGKIRDRFWNNVGHFSNLHLLRMSSEDAAYQFPDRSVDMVFIDGNHDVHSVMLDIELWLPRTKRLLCGHDRQHPGVSAALIRSGLEYEWHEAENAETIWYVNIKEDL